MRADTHSDSRSSYFLHRLQSGRVGYAKNLNADRLDQLVRFLRPFIGTLYLYIQGVCSGKDTNNCKLGDTFIYVTELSKCGRLAIKDRLNASLIMIPEFIGFALFDLIAADENNRIGHNFTLSLRRVG